MSVWPGAEIVTRPLAPRTATRPLSVEIATGLSTGVAMGTPFHVFGTKPTLDGARSSRAEPASAYVSSGPSPARLTCSPPVGRATTHSWQAMIEAASTRVVEPYVVVHIALEPPSATSVIPPGACEARHDAPPGFVSTETNRQGTFQKRI